jgi:hypothetical protein
MRPRKGPRRPTTGDAAILEVVAALPSQLRQLHDDLKNLVDRDPEQEVTGVALPLIDAVVAEARRRLPPESTLQHQVIELISLETIEEGNAIRAADALLVVGQLLAATEHYEREQQQARARRAMANRYAATKRDAAEGAD